MNKKASIFKWNAYRKTDNSSSYNVGQILPIFGNDWVIVHVFNRPNFDSIYAIKTGFYYIK